MDLLSSQDWLDIRSALKDVKDTFLKKPVTYVQRITRTLDKFHESRSDDLTAVEYSLNALVVYSTTQEEGQATQKPHGFFDDSQGYFLLDYQELRDHSPSFINVYGGSTFIINQDSFKANGEEVVIIGVDLVGPTETDFQLVKVFFKRQITA